jgi:nucleoid-associated protein YgaU
MANEIQFWLTHGNGAERLRLPVNPELISVMSSHGYEDVSVNKLGEYTIIGDPRLREYTLSSFFPRDYNPSYCEYSNFPAPWDAVATIERWKSSGKPSRLTIAGTPINEAVTIRTFNYDPERGGAPGDIYFELTLKQFAFVEFERKVSLTTAVSGIQTVNKRADTRTTPTKYTVRTGDTLSKIAKRLLNDSAKWTAIYDRNKKVIGPNPNLIIPGQVLEIPA